MKPWILVGILSRLQQDLAMSCCTNGSQSARCKCDVAGEVSRTFVCNLMTRKRNNLFSNSKRGWKVGVMWIARLYSGIQPWNYMKLHIFVWRLVWSACKLGPFPSHFSKKELQKLVIYIHALWFGHCDSFKWFCGALPNRLQTTLQHLSSSHSFFSPGSRSEAGRKVLI